MEPQVTTRADLLKVLLGAVLTSLSPIMVRLAETGPSATGAFRMIFGGAALLVFILARRGSFRAPAKIHLAGFLGGLIFTLNLAIWHRGIELIGPGLATILGNFQVFLMALFGVLVLGERPGWRLWVAIPAALLGLVLIVDPEGGALTPAYKLGLLLGGLSAILYTAYLINLRRAMLVENPVPAETLMAWITIYALICFLPELARSGESLAVPDLKTGLALVVYGVLCHALGWILITRGMPGLSASRAGLMLLLQPSLAFIWDILIFDRPTGGLAAIGAVLALGGIYLGSTANIEKKEE